MSLILVNVVERSLIKTKPMQPPARSTSRLVNARSALEDAHSVLSLSSTSDHTSKVNPARGLVDDIVGSKENEDAVH